MCEDFIDVIMILLITSVVIIIAWVSIWHFTTPRFERCLSFAATPEAIDACYEKEKILEELDNE